MGKVQTPGGNGIIGTNEKHTSLLQNLIREVPISELQLAVHCTEKKGHYEYTLPWAKALLITSVRPLTLGQIERDLLQTIKEQANIPTQHVIPQENVVIFTSQLVLLFGENYRR